VGDKAFTDWEAEEAFQVTHQEVLFSKGEVIMGSFKASENETPAFEPMPVSWQEMILVEAKRKTTKAGTGEYINAAFKIVSGEYEGRMVWSLFNLDNPNERAMEISRGKLAELMVAVGVDELDDMWDWSPLFSMPFAGRLKIIPASGQYDAKNDVAAYKSLDEQEVSEGGDDDMPWEE
jgi:hypothetical protein